MKNTGQPIRRFLTHHPLAIIGIYGIARASGLLRNVALVRIIPDLRLLDLFFIAQIPFQVFSSLIGGSVALSYLRGFKHDSGSMDLPSRLVLQKLLRRVNYVSALLIAASLVVIYCAALIINGKVDPLWFSLLLVGFGGGWLQGDRSILSSHGQLYGKFTYESASLALMNLLFVALLSGSALLIDFLGGKWPSYLVGIWLSSTVVSFAVMAQWIGDIDERPASDVAIDYSKKLGYMREILRDTPWFTVCGLSFLSWIYIDRIFATRFTEGTVTDVAMLSSLYHMITTAIGGNLSGVFHASAVSTFQDDEGIKRMFHRFSSKTFMWSAGAAGLLFSVRNSVLALVLPSQGIHSNDNTIVLMLFLYLIAASLAGLGLISYRTLALKRLTRFAAWLSVQTVLLNLVVTYLATSLIGYLGIPVGLLVAQGTYAARAYVRSFSPSLKVGDVFKAILKRPIRRGIVGLLSLFLGAGIGYAGVNPVLAGVMYVLSVSAVVALFVGTLRSEFLSYDF